MSGRCLTRAEAAEYCGLTVDGFNDWRRRKLIPGPIKGTRRWDRKALDLALDKASGIHEPQTEGGALDEWRRKREAAQV